MAPSYLDGIVATHRRRAARDDRRWHERAEKIHVDAPSLTSALRAGPNLALIAEIKRRSPSKDWLQRDLDAAQCATRYQEGGASALSVLTDEQYFAGSLADLRAARAASDLPCLRKDFTVSENDLLDAAESGASAVLLIVAVLSDDELARFLELARRLGLESLVEVHDREELTRALDHGAELIGVNQRDLHTFEVDVDRARALARFMTNTCTKVCESGITSVSDVARVADAGFDGVLVGEALLTSEDLIATTKEFANVPRTT